MFRPVNRSSSGLQHNKSQMLFIPMEAWWWPVNRSKHVAYILQLIFVVLTCTGQFVIYFVRALLDAQFKDYSDGFYINWCRYKILFSLVLIWVSLGIYHYHHHVPEGLGVFPVPWSSRRSWFLHLFLGLPMFFRPFSLYCSACFGSLFVSILCTCCSHFFWYCFISFIMFCAPVFCLILSNTNNFCLMFSVKTHHSDPYTTTGLIRALYNLILMLKGQIIFQNFSGKT